MTFTETTIAGVVAVDLAPVTDARGFFARLHCAEDFARAGHPFGSAQTSLSRNMRAGTLRGLHWQAPPHAEAKLVRVVRGRAFDVAVDLRPGSPTYTRWLGFDLGAENGRAVLIPEGVAHGFITLDPETDVLYQIAQAFRPGVGRGARWDDPAFGITWPRAPVVISDRDAGYPDFEFTTADQQALSGQSG